MNYIVIFGVVIYSVIILIDVNRYNADNIFEAQD